MSSDFPVEKANAKFAPIALFAYQRPDHLARAIASLLQNPEASSSDLYVFSDGPKSEAHRPGVEAVRSLLKNITGFRSVTITEREENLGLANSIIRGVTSVVNEYGQIIVLEDDLIVSRNFLAFMNDGLNRYRENENVASIHGYCYPLEDKSLPDTFFIRGADCWGWATWKESWQEFEADGRLLLERLESGRHCDDFDFGGSFPYVNMLKDQIAGKNDSWAIRWYASAYLNARLTLYPRESLTENIGLDGSGSHCQPSDQYGNMTATVGDRRWPESCEENPRARREFSRFFDKQSGIGQLGRWLRFLRRKIG
ncbi:MAG: hypothetical protein RL318_76 [Fibrobacterota bacterium]|jgi:hypothetical protein